jgi:hypothetical protein
MTSHELQVDLSEIMKARGIHGLDKANRVFSVGLEKVKMPKQYRQFMRQMGMTDVYKVPIRKTGLTGSGHEGECHDNVAKIQAVYGGKSVKGFFIYRDTMTKKTTSQKKKVFRFVSHSVWLTPEGKLADVTYGWVKNDVDYIIEGCDLNTIWFSPVVSFDCQKTYYHTLGNYIVPKNYKKFGLWVETDRLESGQWNKIHTDFCESISKKNHIYDLNGSYFDLVDSETSQGGFTESSSATGRSWSKIWNDFVVEKKMSGWRVSPLEHLFS